MQAAKVLCITEHPNLFVKEINERGNEECFGKVEQGVHHKNPLLVFPLDTPRVD